MAAHARFLTMALGICAVAMPVFADESANDEFQGGMRVYVDPATGQLVSAPGTDSQRVAAASDSSFSQDVSRITEATAADGSKMYILNGEFELALSASADASGKLHYACNNAEHAALAPTDHASAHATAAARDDR